MPVRGRFAPSPSGRLHIGNMLSSLLAWLDVRSRGGEMLFRLEDLDPERSWEDCALMMADDLRWLGLDWDLGWPMDKDCRQGRRTAEYESAFAQLGEAGLLYRCWCSRAERLAASAPHPGEENPGSCRCRSLPEGEIAALERRSRRAAFKVITPDADVTVEDGHYGTYTENLARGGGDFIVRRSDGVFAYQLAVTVDDGLMGVTEVVRGRDLLGSTARQIWLHRLFGFTPPTFYHIPLLLAPDGRRLSKRDADLDLGRLRAHMKPERLVGALAFAAGLIDRDTPVAPAELVDTFSWDKIPNTDLYLPDIFHTLV